MFWTTGVVGRSVNWSAIYILGWREQICEKRWGLKPDLILSNKTSRHATQKKRREAGHLLNLLLLLLHLTLKWSLGCKIIYWPSITKGKTNNGSYNNYAWILWLRVSFHYLKHIFKINVNVNSLKFPSLVHPLPTLPFYCLLPLFQVTYFETSIHKADITDSMRRKSITAVCTRQHKTRAAKTQSKLH